MEDDFILIKGNGPILITAPHNIKTYRYCNSPSHANESNNYEPGEFRVLEHARENHVEQILNRLYKKMGKKNCSSDGGVTKEAGVAGVAMDLGLFG